MWFWNRRICRILKTFLSQGIIQVSMPLVLSPWPGMPFPFILIPLLPILLCQGKLLLNLHNPVKKGNPLAKLSPVFINRVGVLCFLLLQQFPLASVIFTFVLQLICWLISLSYLTVNFPKAGAVSFLIPKPWHHSKHCSVSGMGKLAARFP